jgi:enediyne biosynthesis protein E4
MSVNHFTRLRVPAVTILFLFALFFPVAGAQKESAPAPAIFADVTRSAGIDFHLTCGGAKKLYIMESMCGGVAIFDYDNDGWPDIFLVNGSTLDDLKNNKSPASKLYHNNHDGTFTDVTEKAGLAHRGWCFGAAVGDYDNDGWDDLYITCLGGSFLYKNNGDGTFRDVTAKAGVGNPGRWGTSAAFGDYDRDGHLDLYVANYVDLDLKNLPEFGSSPFCTYRGFSVSCGPRGLAGSRDRLYHNNGDGTFTDVTEQMKIDAGSYYGLGVIWGDYDGDGWPDIYVANDSTPSLLYHNNQGKSFTETAVTAGVAFSEDGREQAGMGVDFGDYDNDGWPDLVKTNFSDDANNLYHNNGDGTFDDRAGATGFGAVSVPFLGFGVRFMDYDNDGWRDVLIANGHVNPQVDEHPLGISYAERALLFHNMKGQKFEEIGLKAGAALKERRVSRGLAVGDLHNDGGLAAVLTNLDGSPAVLKNVAKGRGHWVRLKLMGVKSNRDAFGARVELVAGGLRQVEEVRANSSFLSASDSRVHFGIGAATKVDEVLVRWPSGLVERVSGVGVDKEAMIREGDGTAVSAK